MITNTFAPNMRSEKQYMLSFFTCYVIHRIESNAKAANLQWIICLVTSHKTLQSIPVLFCEHGVVVAVQGRSLEQSQAGGYQGGGSI